jgi:hypothetical protein
MAMRIDIAFDLPLSAEQRTSLHLAIAGLAKSTRLRLHADGRGARVIGEAMSRERVSEALEEVGLVPVHIDSSLDDDENAEADDVEVTSTKERVRPIGR